MRPFTAGPHVIDPPVVLAPMEGVTDRAFRTLVRGLGGCGLTVTEFVSSEGLTREVESAWKMAELDPDEHPVSIQIYGRCPERMAAAARHCEALGADLVDINLGCPSKRVVSGCAGSALMREVSVARDIFQAVSEAITVPMTVKMRLGWDYDSVNAPEVAALAVEHGAQMVAVHGRTRTQAYKGHARWDLIRHVRDAVTVPLLVNGDIVCPDSARRALEASGADGVMVGRGVMGDPWTLRRIADALAGVPFVEPTLEERRDVLLEFIDRMERVGGYRTPDGGGAHGDGSPGAGGQARGAVAPAVLDGRSLVRLKKVVTYFSKGLYNAGRLRDEIQRAGSLDDARVLVRQFFAALIDDEPRRTWALGMAPSP